MKIRILFRSLFFKLISGFLLIILLLLAMNGISMHVMKNKVHTEVLRYNDANMKNTVERFEKQWQDLLHSTLKDVLLSSEVKSIYRAKHFDHFIGRQVLLSLKEKPLTQQFEYISAMAVVFKKHGMVVSTGSVMRIDDLFTYTIADEQYPPDFWSNLEMDRVYELLPVGSFRAISTYQDEKPAQELVPMVVRHHLYPDMYCILFLDINKMLHAFHSSINDRFIMLNDEQIVIYATDDVKPELFHNLTQNQSFAKQGEEYYFYLSGKQSGLTYVNMVKDAFISSEIAQLNFYILMFIAASLIISIGISIFFSMKVHQPVRNIIHSLEKQELYSIADGHIEEFNRIGRKLREIHEQNQHIHKNLEMQQPIVMSHAYGNIIKRIYNDRFPAKGLKYKDRPFMVVAFNFKYRQAFMDEIGEDESKAIYYYRAFIDREISQWNDEAMFFQFEAQQVVSLVFEKEQGIGADASIDKVLDKLKKIFDIDQSFCLATIAVSEQFHHSSELARSYEQVQKLMGMRRLGQETQILYASREEEEVPDVSYSFKYEQELYSYLQAGNMDGVHQWIERMLHNLYKKQAIATQFHEFSVHMMDRIKQSLIGSGVDIEELLELEERLEEFALLQEYEQFFERYMVMAAEKIQLKKEEHDPILSVVLPYIETYYDKDLSLDLLAEHMQLSAGYLSAYFKKKSGMNFIDYLNQVRIEKAKLMLEQTDVKVQEIGEQIGYTSANSFYRMFKKWIGMTPGDYRRQARERS